MASMLEQGFRDLYDIGVLDILFPFILIFTLIFAVLQRTKVLGKDKDGHPFKNFNVIIALVMAMATIIPHVLWGNRDPRNPYLSNGFIDVVQVMNNAFPNISLIIVAILMFLIVVGIWGKNIDIAKGSLGGIVMFLSIIAVVVVFAVSAGWMGTLPYWLRFLDNPQTQSLVVVILIFGIIIRFIVGGDPSSSKDKKKGIFETLNEALQDSDGKSK